MADPKWQTHLPPFLTKFIKGVQVSGPLLDLLVQRGLLTFAERSIVDRVQPNTEEQKARQLIELMLKKPTGSFDKFCSVLEEIGYEGLARSLRSGVNDED